MKFIVLAIMFILIGAFFIISENNLSLRNPDARQVLVQEYSLWIGKIFDNSKNLAGYVVKMDWLPSE